MSRESKFIAEYLGGDNAFAPSDLYSKTFGRSLMGGYAPQDVDAFLRQVADVFEKLILEVRELERDVERKDKDLEEFRQMESTLQDALVSSQRMNEEMVTAAREKADIILREAELEKKRRLDEASSLPEELRDEVRRLQAQRDTLRREIASILRSHGALLDGAPESASNPESTRLEDTEP